MKHIIIASHGTMASGIKNSLDILTGDVENIYTVDAYINELDFTIDLKKIIKEVKLEDQLVIFTDLEGGSVNQKITAMIFEGQHRNAFIVTGMNLSVILSVHLDTRLITHDVLDELIGESPVKAIKQLTMEKEEDFF